MLLMVLLGVDLFMLLQVLGTLEGFFADLDEYNEQGLDGVG
jgi:hypothetical protein